MTPNDSEMTPVNFVNLIQNKEYFCEYCNKKVSKNSNLHRHYRRCQKKKECDLKNSEYKELSNKIKKLEDKNIELETKLNKTTINNTTNITYIRNDKVLNYLNTNFQDTIEMDNFIHKIKTDNILSRDMMNCFLNCYHNGGVESFGSTLVKYLNDICKKMNINIFPLCCSDSNLRSHKEKNKEGWETVIDTTKIENIINDIVTDIYLETGDMIYLNAKERKQICNLVKKSYGISSLLSEEDMDDCKVLIPI